MNIIAIYGGIDYHDDEIQVCVMDINGRILMNRSCKNDWRTIVRMVERHGRLVCVGIEACCGASDLAEELVNHAGWNVDLAHPGFVARMKHSRDKTDWGDAHMLADLERVGYLPKVWLAPQNIRELRKMVRYRQQLVDERRNIKLRIWALLRENRLKNKLCRTWTKGWLQWLYELDQLGEQSRWILDRHLENLKRLGEDICLVENRLALITKDDVVVQRLLEIPGVGPVTSWMLRAEIGRFDRFRSGKQLSHFCGLSPRNASSGKRQADAGLIKACNPSLRAILIQAAHRLMNYDKRWGELAYKMKAAGKPKSVITAAVANRWIRWIYHQMQPEGLVA